MSQAEWPNMKTIDLRNYDIMRMAAFKEPCAFTISLKLNGRNLKKSISVFHASPITVQCLDWGTHPIYSE